MVSPISTPPTAASIAPSTKVKEITLLVSMPSRLAMRMSSAQARQARPMRERPINNVSAIISTSVTPTISRREYGTVTVKSLPIWNSMAPEISTGTDTSRAPCPIWT
ncbi:hypothetical protein D9M72_376940 [compost metagenome]